MFDNPSKRLNYKRTLHHINECYYVFKVYAIEKNIQDQDDYIQLMLKNYIQNDQKFIDENTINACKIRLMEMNEE